MSDANSEHIFATEREFVGELRTAILNSLPPHEFPLRYTTELAVGNNIADLAILLSQSPDFDSEFRPFTTRESVVLASLRRNGATRVDVFERRYGVSRSEFRSGSLRWLVESGLVELGKGGRIRFAHDTWPFKVIAIEAKLRRWNQALHQAISYTQYADESYVAIPAAHSRVAIANKNYFIEHGIGLLILGRDGVRVECKSATHDVHNWRREFVISRLAVSGGSWSSERQCLTPSSTNSEQMSPLR